MKEAYERLRVHPNTLRRWIHEGKVKAVRTPGGKFRIPEEEVLRLEGEIRETKILGYARVSSSTQKDDLERQKQLISNYARGKGYGEIEILSDIGSGLNERRRNFLKLLELVTQKRVSAVIVVSPDRLTMFGFETLKRLCSKFGTSILAINEEEKTLNEELVEDLIAIISHFAGRLYGMRSNKYNEVVKGARKLLSG
jgi:putative resolvase